MTSIFMSMVPRSCGCAAASKPVAAVLIATSVGPSGVSAQPSFGARVAPVRPPTPARRGTIGGPITAESPVIPGNPIQAKSAELSVYAEIADDCHAEGRGFESLQPLRERPLYERLFSSLSVRWYFCVVANGSQTV